MEESVVTLTVAARVSALDEWELLLVVVVDVAGGSASRVGLIGLLLLLLLLLFEVFDFLDFFNFLDFLYLLDLLDFLNGSGGAGVLLEEGGEVVGISWVEVALQWSEVNGNLIDVSDGELGWVGRTVLLSVAADLVSWVVQRLSVLWAALPADGGLEWEQEVTERRRAASGRDVVVLSGTTAGTQSTELVDVLGLGDLLSALAGLGDGVVGGGSTAGGVGSADSSDDWESVGGGGGWAAEIGGGIVSGGATARTGGVGGGKQRIDSSVAALARAGIESGESAALSAALWNVGDLELRVDYGGESLATSTVRSVALEGGGVDTAAGLGGCVESSGAAALEVSVGVVDDGSITAKACGGVERPGSTASKASAARVHNAQAASLGGGVEGGGEESGITALKVVVRVGDGPSGTAKLVGRVESAVATAALTVGNSVGDNVGTCGECVWAAKIGGWVVASGTAALKVVVVVVDNVSEATKLGRWIVTPSSATLLGGRNGSVVAGGGSGGRFAANLIVGQESGSTAGCLVVGVSVWDGEDGVDAANLGGGVESSSASTTSQSVGAVLFEDFK